MNLNECASANKIMRYTNTLDCNQSNVYSAHTKCRYYYYYYYYD